MSRKLVVRRSRDSLQGLAIRLDKDNLIKRRKNIRDAGEHQTFSFETLLLTALAVVVIHLKFLCYT